MKGIFMSCKRLSLLMVGLALAAAFVFSGCSLLRPKAPSFGSDLKMKVAVMPFENSIGVKGADPSRQIADLLSRQLSESRSTVVVPSSEIEAYVQANQIPTPLTQNTATMVGRALNLNAVVFGSISEVAQVQKRTGWFRWFTFLVDKKEFVNAVLVARVVDVENGTILVAETGQGEALTGVTEDDDWGPVASRNPDQKIIDTSLNEAASALAANIEQALRNAPWKGIIVQVEGDAAVLNAGQDVGIRRGDHFSVYNRDEKVTNVAGQTYVIPGQVKAQLEAADVADKTTRLRIVSGSVEPGDIAQNTK